MNLSENATVVDAKEWLKARVFKRGARCPVCDQFAKVYRRPINSGMARSLITMYRAATLDWQHIPTTVGGRSREEGKLRYWGLIEEELVIRPDGGRAGWWRVTPLGEEWVLGRTTVPKHALIYDGRLLKVEGDPTSIRTALGRKFNYVELMAS